MNMSMFARLSRYQANVDYRSSWLIGAPKGLQRLRSTRRRWHFDQDARLGRVFLNHLVVASG